MHWQGKAVARAGGGQDRVHGLGFVQALVDGAVGHAVAHQRCAQQSQRGVAVALHDLSLAARYCSRVLMLKAGRAVASGRPADVLTPEALARTYGIRATLADIDGIPVLVAREALL